MSQIDQIKAAYEKAADDIRATPEAIRAMGTLAYAKKLDKYYKACEAYDKARKAKPATKKKLLIESGGRIPTTDSKGKPMWDRNAMTAAQYFGKELHTNHEILDSVPDGRK